MAGTALEPSTGAAASQGALSTEAQYIIAGTSTSNDGKLVPGVRLVGDDGSPVGTAKPLTTSGAATIADGADVTQGAKADAAATDSTGSWSLIALFKRFLGLLPAALSAAGALKVDLATLIAGEDLTNNRLGTFQVPADADSVLEVLQNAVSAIGNGTAINMKSYRGLSLAVVTTGTITGGVITFESTVDDVTWLPLGLAASDTGTIASALTFAGATTQGYYLPSGNGARSQFRARISSTITGGGTVTIKSRKQP